MTTVEVPESGPPTQCWLAPEMALELTQSGVVRCQPAGGSQWSVFGQGKVGVLCVGDLTVRVLPKLHIDRLLFLLGYHPGFRWQEDLVDFDQADDLVHVIAEAFVRQAQRALGRGVLQGYTPIDDELSTIRGRLRIREQVTRRFGRVTPVLVHYDEFSIDIAENQLVKAAARRLRSVPGLGKPVARRLLALCDRLDEVRDLVPGAPLPTWRPTRRNQHYESVLWFATMVLRGSSIDLPAGSMAVQGFVVNMAKVFEDFLSATLSEAFVRLGGRVHPQSTCYLDHGTQVAMRPDLLWRVDGRPAAVIDAKYKIEHSQEADLYQVLAYCTALDLPVGHLVYAKGNVEPRHYEVIGGVQLFAHALDLSAPPSDLLTQIDELARLIASTKEASSLLHH